MGVAALVVALVLSGAPQRISVSDAVKLVHPVRREDPEAGAKGPSLRDVTGSGVWEKMHCQVFKLNGYTNSVEAPESWLVCGGKSYPLGIGFGGSGLMSNVAADLRGDGKFELAYTYSWGSGEHRTHIAVAWLEGGKLVHREPDFVVSTYDIFAEPDGAGGAKLCRREMVSRMTTAQPFGTLHLKGTGEKTKVNVTLDPSLPKELRDSVWQIEPKKQSG